MAPQDPSVLPASHLSRLGFAKRSYLSRSGGLAAAFFMFAVLMGQKQVPLWVWVGPAVYSFLWPQLAWRRARNAANPRDAERGNLLADQFLIGVWMASMQFSLLPCILSVSMTGMNTIAGGGLRLWWRGCVLQALGVALGIAIFGFDWQPYTSTLTILGSIPLLVFQPLAVGYTALTAIQALNAKRIELERLSQHDGLSGLYNRMHWEKQVRAEFARFGRSHETVVLVLADLDNFKRVNDSFGHPVGDEAIRRFAAALRRVLRETDVLGRFGGEEFGILLPGTGARAALDTVERLRRDLHDKPLTDQMLVTASFGLVELNPGIPSVEEWLRLVDQMLYQAKDQGRDQVVEFGELTPSDRVRLDV